jgi:hypothetical protein
VIHSQAVELISSGAAFVVMIFMIRMHMNYDHHESCNVHQAVELISSGAAFVIFETEAGRRACLKAHRLDPWSRLMPECLGGVARPRFDNSVNLAVVPAPEPSDVYWENLEVGPREVRQRALYTLLVAMGMIGLSLVLLLLLTRSKDRSLLTVFSLY